MKITIKFVVFLAYSIGIFFVKDFRILALLFVIQMLLMLLCRISIQEALKTILHLMPFILFTVVIDLLVMIPIEASQIGIRLIIVCHITYIFGKTTTAMQMAKAIQNLLYPLKWFGVNINNIGIMVSLAITFIPIMKQEIETIQYSLIAKGFDMHFTHQIKHLNYIMVPLFRSLLQRVSKLEEALKSKGYVEE